MKAISVKQPFADNILNLLKEFEYRSWTTKYRGHLLICSTKAPHTPYDASRNGVCICVVDLTSIRAATKHEKNSLNTLNTNKPIFAWRLENPEKTELIPVKGKLGLFTPPTELIHRLSIGTSTCE